MKFLIPLLVLVAVALAAEIKEADRKFLTPKTAAAPRDKGKYKGDGFDDHDDDDHHHHRGDNAVKIVAKEVGDADLKIKLPRKHLSLKMAPERLVIYLDDDQREYSHEEEDDSHEEDDD